MTVVSRPLTPCTGDGSVRWGGGRGEHVEEETVLRAQEDSIILAQLRTGGTGGAGIQDAVHPLAATKIYKTYVYDSSRPSTGGHNVKKYIWLYQSALER